MSKKRAIISYDKLSIAQKKQLMLAFPDGFSNGMTQIKTPTGETLEALLWETDEIIYLIKIIKPILKTKIIDEEEDDFEEDDLLESSDVKVDDDDFENDDDDENDEYDTPDINEDDEEE